MVRVGLSLPLSIYQHLFIPRRRRGVNRFRNNVEQRNTPPTEQPTNNENRPNDENIPNSDTIDIPENEHPRPSTIVSGWTER